MTDPIRNLRRLVIALIISGALNVIFVSFLFYFLVMERPPTPYFELKPPSEQEGQSPLAIDHSNNEVIRFFRKMPLDWLLARLSNSQPVENGYTQRDLALALLVELHNFDLERALSGVLSVEQRRTIEYGKYRNGQPAILTVFPGISDAQYSAIVSFAKREKWPVTSKGLFQLLVKQDKDTRDATLVDSMLMTPEFFSVHMLFERSGSDIDKQDVLSMILEGDWKTLSSFVEQQKVSQDLSSTRRQKLLMDYIGKGSAYAAKILIKTDPAFAKLKLDDAQVIRVLEVLDAKDSDAQAYANEVYASPRSDAVRNSAGRFSKDTPKDVQPIPKTTPAVLVEVSQTPTKLPSIPKITPKIAKTTKENTTPLPRGRLIVSSVPSISPPQTVKNDIIYVVQNGDSLWKISRKFNVDVDVIKSYNHLETEYLSPGKTLKIPKK